MFVCDTAIFEYRLLEFLYLAVVPKMVGWPIFVLRISSIVGSWNNMKNDFGGLRKTSNLFF